MEPRWGSIAEAARLVGMSPRTIRRRIGDGTIAAKRFGPRLIRVDLNRLEDLARPVLGSDGE